MFCSSEANNRSSYLFHKLTSFSMKLKFTFIVWHFLLFYLPPAWIHVKIPNPWGNKQESVSQSHRSKNKHRCLPRPQAVRNPTTQIGVYFCWLLKWRGIEAHDLLLFIFVRHWEEIPHRLQNARAQGFVNLCFSLSYPFGFWDSQVNFILIFSILFMLAVIFISMLCTEDTMRSNGMLCSYYDMNYWPSWYVFSGEHGV